MEANNLHDLLVLGISIIRKKSNDPINEFFEVKDLVMEHLHTTVGGTVRFDKCRYLLAKADICLMLSITLEDGLLNLKHLRS